MILKESVNKINNTYMNTKILVKQLATSTLSTKLDFNTDVAKFYQVPSPIILKVDPPFSFKIKSSVKKYHPRDPIK